MLISRCSGRCWGGCHSSCSARSLPGLRVWPALAAWATVVAGGLIAREFGGGRRAQLLAAIGAATMPVLLGAAHVANTTACELLAWAGLALVVARIGRTGDCRWWLAGGLVAGLGVADDHSMSFFAITLVIGALLSGGRRMIWNRWFLAGAAIAVAFEVPDLWWQAQHGWATIAMTHALNRENGGLANIGTWVAGQLGMVTLALAWVWVAGLRFLWRSGRPLWRAMAWAYGLLFVLFAVTTGAQTYYLGAAYVYLLAAGGGHPVESVRPPQPGMGRPRLYLHRPSPALGPDMATAAPLRLTTQRRNRGTRACAGQAELPWSAGLTCGPGHHRASTIAHTRTPHVRPGQLPPEHEPEPDSARNARRNKRDRHSRRLGVPDQLGGPGPVPVLRSVNLKCPVIGGLSSCANWEFPQPGM